MAHILLLEDELALIRQYCRILEANGHSVAAFRAFLDAWDHFANGKVDLVIADLFIARNGSFAEKGGITLISQIKQLAGSDVPILAISASFSGELPRQQDLSASTAKTVGANLILAKPITEKSLVDAVDMLLNCRTSCGQHSLGSNAI